MNVPIKTKVNRIGLYGMILAIIMIIASAIIFTYHLLNMLPGFPYFLASVASLVDACSEAPAENALAVVLVISSCIGGMVSSIGHAIAYSFLFRVSKKLRCCDTPFEDRVIRATSVFGWVLFGVSVLSSVFNLLTEIRYGNGFLVLANILPSFSFVFSLIVLFLVRVFRHGAELQKERDETL